MGIDLLARRDRCLGLDLISELSRRGQRGMFFPFAGYRRLRGLTTVNELRELLDDYGFEVVTASENVVEVADGINALTDARGKQTTILAILASFDPLLILCTFPLWIAFLAYWIFWSPTKAAAKRIADAKTTKAE